VIDLKNLTFGVEYEFGDIWRCELPPGLTWNTADYSIVSSTGVANDPRGRAYKRGGEINSEPTDTIGGQLELFDKLLKQRPEAAVNHRTNLHIHVRVPGLRENLSSLQTLLSYIDRNQEAVYAAIEPIPVPRRKDFSSEAEYKGARKRFNRRKLSHQFKVSPERVSRAMRAKTPEEFFQAHAFSPPDSGWGFFRTIRAGVNLLQLLETDTIEFRHFTSTREPEELFSCLKWSENFVQGAFDDAPLSELLSAHPYKFPQFAPYNHDMEICYRYTEFGSRSRKIPEARLSRLSKQLNLNNCTARELTQAIKQVEGDKFTECV
jgi:hypothetical protein